MKDVISIIIPVYNVVAYLPECIDSVLKQCYKQLEIILVDDGSTDGSGELCDKYAEIDDRIKVIHQMNRGAANAKNVGLCVANGEFLAFVDSDDYLESNAYSFMIEQLETYQADVIQCGFRNVYYDSYVNYVTLDDFVEFSCVDYLRRFTIDWTCGLLWDKLYRRELFSGVLFEEGHKIDDEFFTYQGIMNAEKIIHMPNIVYNYRKRKSSVMMQKKSRKKMVLDKLDYLVKRREKVLTRYPELKQDFDYHFLSMLVILSKDAAATEESIRITKLILKQYFVNEKHCKIDLSLWRQLLCLQFRSIERILQLCQEDEKKSEKYRCFE